MENRMPTDQRNAQLEQQHQIVRGKHSTTSTRTRNTPPEFAKTEMQATCHHNNKIFAVLIY
jgi:hypothetical protein